MAFKKEDLRIGDVMEYNIAETPEAPEWVDCTVSKFDLCWFAEHPESFNLFHRKKENHVSSEIPNKDNSNLN